MPSAAAFLGLGSVLAAALFQTGQFSAADSRYVWGILAGSAVAAATMGRLYSSAYYALRDTRTPLRFAVLRVLLTTFLGYLAAVPLPPLLGLEPRWGAAGLTATAGIAGWVEFFLLQRGMNARIGATGLVAGELVRLWAPALLGAAIGYGVQSLLPGSTRCSALVQAGPVRPGVSRGHRGAPRPRGTGAPRAAPPPLSPAAGHYLSGR